MNQALKPNDMFVATISNVEASTLDLIANDINFDNTQFLSKEEYKKTPFVQKMFTKDNVFDESAFDQLYNVAAEKYKDLSDKKSYDSLEDFIEYDPFSASASLGSKKRNPFVSYEKQINPKHQKVGIEDFNAISASDKSLKELAQSHKIWNPETKSWEEDTPESLNFFDKTLGHSLSYAKYEQTGEQINPVTGELGYHEAGEWILDKNGEVFTQYTPKTDLLHSEIVSTWDILSDEGSWANSLDVFDSDDLHKSTTGIVIKNIFKIAPYLFPQTRGIWGAVQAAYSTMSSLPTLYKQLDALASNSSTSNAYMAASGMEHWMKKFDTSTTDASKESFFNAENLFGLVSEVWGQIHQQKAAAKFGTTLGKFAGLNPEKVADVEKLSKLGQQMSLGYMALTGTADVYNSALQAGYDNRTASVAGLLSAGALFGIMNLNATTRGIGTWFLGPEDGVDTRAMSAITKVSKGLFKDIEEGLQKGGIKEVQKTFKKRLYSSLDDLSKNASTIGKASLSEALEETSEEVIQDAVKGIIDGASALGLTGKQGHFGVIEDVFSMSGLQRYLTTALGGGVGGGMFHLQQNYLDPFTNKIFGGKEGPTVTLSEQLDKYNLITALMEGRYQDIMDEIDRCKKFLPTDKFTGILDQNLRDIEFLGQTDLTYADVITEISKKQVNATYQNLKALLGEANVTTKRLFDLESPHLAQMQAYNLLDENNKVIFTQYLNAKNASLLTQVSALKEKYEKIKEDSAEKKEAKKEYEAALDILKKHFSKEGFVNNIVEGYMISNVKFASKMNPFLSEENFYKSFYQDEDEFKTETGEEQEYKDLTQEQKNIIKSRLNIAKKLEADTIDKLVVQIPVFRHIYLKAQEKFSKPIKNWHQIEQRHKLFQALRSQFEADDFILSEIEKQMKKGLRGKAEALYFDTFINVGLGRNLSNDETLNLLDLRHDYDFAEELIKTKLIKFTDDNSEEGGLSDKKGVKVLKALINQMARVSGIQNWDKNALQGLAQQINKALNQRNLKDEPYLHTIVQLSKIGEDPLSSEDLMNLNIQVVDSEENFDKFNKNINLLKVKTFLDLLEKYESENILEEEFDYILKQLYNTFGITINPNQTRTNQLKQLENNIINRNEYISEAEDDTEKERLGEEWDVKYGEIYKYIQKLKKLNIKQNPFKELFNLIHFDLYDKHNNIIDYLIDNNNHLQNLDITTNETEHIESALDTIMFMQTIIDGMHAGKNGFSVNGALQGYIDLDPDTKKKKEDFATINDDDYTIIKMYLDDVKIRLRSMSQLNTEMSKSKSEEFKKIREISYKGLITGYENFNNKIISEIVANVTREDDDDDETYLYKIRIALYKDRDKIFNEIGEIVKLLNIDNLKSHFSLNEAMKSKEFIRIQILDLLASISVDPKEFLEKSKQHYSQETFDPRYDQEFIMHNTYAWVKAMQEGNEGAKKAYDTYMNRLKDVFETAGQNKMIFENALSIYGAAGSGKTAVAAMISKMLDSEVYVTSSQQKKVNDLKQVLSVDKGGTLDNLIESELNQFISEVEEKFSQFCSANSNRSGESTSTFKHETEYFKIELNATFNGSTLMYVSDMKITKKQGGEDKLLEKSSIIQISGFAPKLLIFNDEVQLNNIFYNYLLSQTGIPIIRIGAHDQVGYSIQYTTKQKVTENGVTKEQDVEVNVAWDEANYVSMIMPKLLGMYRADNSVMKEAVTRLSANLNGTHEKVVLGNMDEEAVVDTKQQMSIANVNKTITFRYGLNIGSEDRFTGIKIDEQLDKNFISNYLYDQKEGNKIPKNCVVITDKPETLPEELKKFEVKTLKDALGSEWDYVILYHPKVAGNTKAYSATKQLYSAITRAKQGVYVVRDKDANSDIFRKAGFVAKEASMPSVESKQVTEYTPVKKTDIENRIDQINSTLENLNKKGSPGKNVNNIPTEDDVEIETDDNQHGEQELDFEKEIEELDKEIRNIGEKGNNITEEEQTEKQKKEAQLADIKKKQQELGQHYNELDPNWRLIQTFYRRGGVNWNTVLDKLDKIQSIADLNTNYKNNTDGLKTLLDECNEDFGAFIYLVAQGEIQDLPSKPTNTLPNKVYWIGLFQRFILSNFVNADNGEYFFWKKSYETNIDDILYKENDKYPKSDGDSLYLLLFKFKDKRFTLGQIAYKSFDSDEDKDFIAKANIGEPFLIKLNTIEEKKINTYKQSQNDIERTCNSLGNGFYQISGIRSFTRDNRFEINNKAEKEVLKTKGVRHETLERYWMTGVDVELTPIDSVNKANQLRAENSQQLKQYDTKIAQYTSFRKILLKIGNSQLKTAIRTEKKVKEVRQLYGTRKNNGALQKRHLIQLLDFYLNKTHKFTKAIPKTTEANFADAFNNVIMKLENVIKNLDDDAKKTTLNDILNLLQTTEIETPINSNNAVKAFLNLFNAEIEYYSFPWERPHKNQMLPIEASGIELSDAVIEPPNLLIVPSESKNETSPVKLKVEEAGGSNTGTSEDPKVDQEILINQIKEKAKELGCVLNTQLMELTSEDQDLNRTKDKIEEFLELIKNTEIKIDFLVQLDITQVDDKLIDNFKEKYKELKCKFD